MFHSGVSAKKEEESGEWGMGNGEEIRLFIFGLLFQSPISYSCLLPHSPYPTPRFLSDSRNDDQRAKGKTRLSYTSAPTRVRSGNGGKISVVSNACPGFNRIRPPCGIRPPPQKIEEEIEDGLLSFNLN